MENVAVVCVGEWGSRMRALYNYWRQIMFYMMKWANAQLAVRLPLLRFRTGGRGGWKVPAKRSGQYKRPDYNNTVQGAPKLEAI